ncbi:MAG: hypothetical protein IPH03_00560 [Tetrasphaera sp.]|nr:hypothetical protein [Tetrasphaera sp.]
MLQAHEAAGAGQFAVDEGAGVIAPQLRHGSGQQVLTGEIAIPDVVVDGAGDLVGEFLSPHE